MSLLRSIGKNAPNNGITAFVTENHIKTEKGSGTFRVCRLFVLAGNRTFYLAVSYLEGESFLVPITDRIISSLEISDINKAPFSSVFEILSAWEALLVLITMYLLSAGVIFGDLRAEDLDRRPLWVNNPSGITIFLFYLLWPLWILIYSSSLLYGSWRLKWKKLYKLLSWLVGISYTGMVVAMAVVITEAVTKWFGDIGWFRTPVFFLGLYLIYIIIRIFRPKKKEFDLTSYY